MYFAGVAANLGAVVMENAQLLESTKKDFETLGQEILQLASRLKPAA